MEKLLNELMMQMNRGFTKIDQRFDHLEGKIDKIETRMDGIEGRFDVLEGRFDHLEIKLDDHATEFRNYFKYIGDRLDIHQSNFIIIDDKLKRH
ncbi:hypothetical protein ACFSO7_01565 [Bacillus sp. CGMCC 1.16607]|uniref:hypothetical protein n=1 Tax=Bacillus sp. CGMCC 1.16607 TaxID=3351842 RepID=UPI00363B9014